MTQQPRDAAFRTALGRRLGELVDALGMTWQELADRLDYGTSQTLRQAHKGACSLSAEKLAALASVHTQDGARRVCVEWLLTGVGEPLIRVQSRKSGSLAQRVEQTPFSIQRQIAAFLDVQGIP